VVDKLLFQYSIRGSFPEIFASRKLSEIAQNFGRFFRPPKFLGAGLPKIVPTLSLLPRGTSTKKFHEDTPTSPEVIEPNTLNFRPNFKFSRFKFFWGTLVPLGGVR